MRAMKLRAFLVVSVLALGLFSVARADAPHVTPPTPPPPTTAPPPSTVETPPPPVEPLIVPVAPPTVVMTEPPVPPPTVTTTDVYVRQPPPREGHWEQQGPEWAASWVMLALTAATSVAAVIVWNDGLGHFRQLQDLCASSLGCTSTDIASSSAHTSQDATNALLGVSIGLGAITLLTFIIEGVVSGNRTRYVLDASREGVRFGFSPFGVSLSGTF